MTSHIIRSPREKIDVGTIESQAHRTRATAVVHAVASLWRNLIARPFARWAAQERAIRELSMLDDRELADLGISRGLIPYAATGKLEITNRYERPLNRSANENRQDRHAA
ncbi:MAG TPA: DUF1127 domain-containing protein [Alphaproteobacteria bacterium]|nr:DUF1127 domain-containing protein [Alphaproteobacteria bacterium]